MPDTILRDNLLQLARELEKIQEKYKGKDEKAWQLSCFNFCFLHLDDAIKTIEDAEERIRECEINAKA